MTDSAVVGKTARVTGRIAPDRVGEVMLSIRGGSEAYMAQSDDPNLTIERGTRVVVTEYFPPRTVTVSPTDLQIN